MKHSYLCFNISINEDRLPLPEMLLEAKHWRKRNAGGRGTSGTEVLCGNVSVLEQKPNQAT